MAAPAAFSAVIVTVTIPAGTMLPAAGDWEITTLQPVATTCGRRFGMTPSQFESTGTAVSEAQVVITGAAVGTTVTKNPQLGPPLTIHDTGVVPAGKVAPDGGLHVTAPQVPLVVGAG
jgi:hypothetical protein